MKTLSRHWRYFLAFALGVLLTTLIAFNRMSALREENRTHKASLNHAVNRGVSFEALYGLCRQSCPQWKP